MSGYYSEWYEKFIESMGIYEEDDLYDALHSLLLRNANTFALNRKVMEKAIDISWVEAIETGLMHVDTVLRNPRKTIEEIEEVVPIALSKKITVQSIRHLAQHTDLIQSIDKETGKITPSKILNVHKEESLLTYENKFVNTLIDRLYIFVDRRYEKLKAVSKDEEVYSMEYTSEVNSGSGSKMNMTVKIETVESLDKTNENGATVWERVEKIRKIIESYKASSFCTEMNGAYIRPPVMRTNAIMKNVDLKACLVLWQFIESYDKVGYEINISDSAQKPDEAYIEDFYNLTALNYLLFRSYVSDDKDILQDLKTRKSKAIAPKIVRKFDKENPDAYDISLDNGSAMISTTGDFSLMRKLPSDANEILAEIDEIIKIERNYLETEEEKKREARRIAEEKERKRLAEEQRKLEQARLAQALKEENERREREKKEREEKERQVQEMLEQKRREQEEKERAEREEAERKEQERLAQIEWEAHAEERAEQERLQKIEDERLAAERAEQERIEFEEAKVKAKEESAKREREKRDAERAIRLRQERKLIEKKKFEDIYLDYSKNPVDVVRRNYRKLKKRAEDRYKLRQAQIQEDLKAKQKLNEEQGISQEQADNAVAERLFGKKVEKSSIVSRIFKRKKTKVLDVSDAQKLEQVAEHEISAEEAEVIAIRKKERADRLREERKIIEQKPFKDIYKDYSRNPVHVIGRLIRKIKNRGKNG